MNRDCDLICFTLSRWDAAISSPALALAKEFARHNRVFYVEHPYTWKDYFQLKNTVEVKRRKQALFWGKNIYSSPSSLPRNLTVVTPELTLPINFLPPGKLYRWLSRINDGIVLKVVRRLISDYQLKEFIFINFFDPYYLRKLPPDIEPLRTVYQSMDDISQVDYSRRHGLELEEEIIRNADYTLCTSKELTRLKSEFSRNVYFHPNAADVEMFTTAIVQKLERPKELQNISQKIIGFTGSIEYRSDFDLLKKIANYHHDKVLFFVGPIKTEEHKSVGLDIMPNVQFAGPKNINELPAFLQHFDCTIIPYRKTVLTKSIYPLKINEYLAAGKPVVATNFSEDIYSFHEVAYVVDTHEEFIETIDRAISENSKERQLARMKVATQNTWKARVEQFWEIVSKEPKREP